MLEKVWNGLRFVAAWLASGALALLILAVGRDPFMLFFRVTLGWSRWTDQLLTNVYYMVGGLAWLIFFLYTDHYFNTSLAKGRLLRAFLRVIGIEAALLFLLQAIRLFYYPAAPATLPFIATLATGLLAGGMLFLGFRKRTVTLQAK